MAQCWFNLSTSTTIHPSSALFHILLLPCATQALHRTKLHLSNSQILQLKPIAVTLKATFSKWIQPSPLLTANPKCSLLPWLLQELRTTPRAQQGPSVPQGSAWDTAWWLRIKADRGNIQTGALPGARGTLLFCSGHSRKQLLLEIVHDRNHFTVNNPLVAPRCSRAEVSKQQGSDQPFLSCEVCTWDTTTKLGMEVSW